MSKGKSSFEYKNIFSNKKKKTDDFKGFEKYLVYFFHLSQQYSVAQEIRTNLVVIFDSILPWENPKQKIEFKLLCG